MFKKSKSRTVLYIFACILSITLLLYPIRAYATEYEDDYDVIVVYDTNLNASK